MKAALLALCLGLGPVLTGCAAARAQGADPSVRLETLMAFSAGQGGITARVSTNGCTTKANFAVENMRGVDGPVLAFRRVKEDPCRAFRADGVDLVWSYEELALDPQAPVRVLNGFAGLIR